MILTVSGAALAEPMEFEIEHDEDDVDYEGMPFLTGSQALELVVAWTEAPDTIRDYETRDDSDMIIVASYRQEAGLSISWWSESAEMDGYFSVADAPFTVKQEVSE